MTAKFVRFEAPNESSAEIELAAQRLTDYPKCGSPFCAIEGTLSELENLLRPLDAFPTSGSAFERLFCWDDFSMDAQPFEHSKNFSIHCFWQWNQLENQLCCWLNRWVQQILPAGLAALLHRQRITGCSCATGQSKQSRPSAEITSTKRICIHRSNHPQNPFYSKLSPLTEQCLSKWAAARSSWPLARQKQLHSGNECP